MWKEWTEQTIYHAGLCLSVTFCVSPTSFNQHTGISTARPTTTTTKKNPGIKPRGALRIYEVHLMYNIGGWKGACPLPCGAQRRFFLCKFYTAGIADLQIYIYSSYTLGTCSGFTELKV
jgi:hypothetical protein